MYTDVGRFPTAMSRYEETRVVDPPPPILQNVLFPPKLEIKGNLSNNWKRFKRVWCNYEIASRLMKQGNEERTATLLTSLGPDALEIVDGLNFASDLERTNPDWSYSEIGVILYWRNE